MWQAPSDTIIGSLQWPSVFLLIHKTHDKQTFTYIKKYSKNLYPWSFLLQSMHDIVRLNKMSKASENHLREPSKVYGNKTIYVNMMNTALHIERVALILSTPHFYPQVYALIDLCLMEVCIRVTYARYTQFYSWRRFRHMASLRNIDALLQI